jgi:salicylate hydroxylase
VASSRTILIAGAGIGGLTTALALAQKGFRAAVFEQSARLEEAGAGIQLSPNAMHVLLALGLGEALRPHAVSAESIRIRKARSGREIVRVPLGLYAERRHGAPYWMIHRGDLQRDRRCDFASAWIHRRRRRHRGHVLLLEAARVFVRNGSQPIVEAPD